jgi:alpha-glucosidase (family GH31 glycosyl hydrolase)
MANYGVSALVLGEKPCELPHFLRAGGEDAPITEVGASLLLNGDNELIVSIGYHLGTPEYQPVSRKSGLDNPAFQHSVAVQIRPSWDSTEVYYFAMASNGEHFGLRYPAVPLPEGIKSEPVADFWTRQTIDDGDCLVAFAIPWNLIGGKPTEPFGINVLYSRAQNAEYLSPVAMDHTREIAPDLFMEVSFGEESQVIYADKIFTTLPSGVRRWQRPAVLEWPSAGTRQAIRMLNAGTYSLEDRIYLCQRWLDWLVLEGFSFHTEGGCWQVGPVEYRPEQARAAVNAALRRDDDAAAQSVLDIFLWQLEQASRAWFGAVWDAAFYPLETITAIECREREVVLTGRFGWQERTFHLSAPLPGCLRLHGDQTGFFDLPPMEAVACMPTADGIAAHFGAVTATIRQGESWSIVVTDADGRERWRLERGDLAFVVNEDGAITAIDLCGTLAEREAVYGFGERFDAVNQRGRALTLYDLDAWEGTIYGLRNQAYKPIPLLHSTAGYTLFLNSSYRLRADVGQVDPSRLRLTLNGPLFDLYLWPCGGEAALKGYTALTGRPVLPPAWALAPWMGGGWGRWKHGPLGDPVAEMLHVVAQFAALDIPHTAIYAEGEGSSDPRLFTALAAKGIRVFTWMNSHMGLKQQQVLLPEVPEDDLPILHREDGQDFPYVDFTHPRANELLRAYWQRYFDLGIAGTMVDFGDLVPEDALFYDGRRGDEMHNFYAYDYHRLYRQVFAERRGDDQVLFSRSAAPGSQRWLGQFAGDHQPNFVGLTAALRGGLNLSACGFSTWGCDIGGYLGWPDPETYIRWVEWGCFSPIMRCHGTEPREPWEYGEEAVRVYAFYARLRMNLLPYLTAAALAAHTTGVPMMRLPQLLDDDPLLADCDDAYLLGRDLLVAPVHAAARERTVRFPRGRWTDFWTGEIIDGSTERVVDAPLDRIPVYLRAGAVVPVQLDETLAWGASLTGSRVGALVATPPAAGDFTLTLDTLDTPYLLLYGCTVAGVAVDGSALPALTGDAIITRPPGWYRDGHRTIVRLPAGLRRQVAITLA